MALLFAVPGRKAPGRKRQGRYIVEVLNWRGLTKVTAHREGGPLYKNGMGNVPKQNDATVSVTLQSGSSRSTT